MKKHRREMNGFGLTTLAILFFTSINFSNPLSAQCALVCKNSITVALDANGQATIYPPMLLQSSVGCSNNFTIGIVDTAGNNVGTTLNASLLGEPLTATLTHPASGNSCVIQITLIDNLPPVLSCGDTLFLWCNQPYTPDTIGYPAVSDNATETDSIALAYTDNFTDLPCYATISGQQMTAYTKRTWTATDESGNSTTCVQHIFFKRATLGMVVFPGHRDGVVNPALECGLDDPTDLDLTGYPTVDGFILDNTFNCDLTVSFNDQSVPICGGARKIIRTWSIFDLCTEDFKVYAQIIKVLDNTPPVVSCPANVSFNSYPSSCSAQVWLPQATAEDACSGAVVTTSWQFGTGNGPFNSVPVGSYPVTYTGKDGCNNTASCQITVTVVDTKKPTALCDNQVWVFLENDGTALIYAETFDNGSYDNCAIDHLQVKRDGEPYDDFVAFECTDIGASIEVKLLVTDVNGLSSECTSYALVVDQIEPEIICPAAVNINCGTNYNNLSITGQPYATDNCSVASTSHTDLVNINNCGNGTVTRTWSATDQNGNTATCQQVITIADNTPITVTFPSDLVFYACQPDTDPSLTGEPVVAGSDCEQLQITHTDYFFYTAQPSCYQLIRKWAIIDWCSYHPNAPNGAGFWDHTQVIEVRDSVAPVLTCPANMDVGIENTTCNMWVDVPLPVVDDCSQQITIMNNSAYAQSNNGKASGTYPKGQHVVIYTVSDGCGNTSSCTMKLTLTDTHAPNPVCNNGISVTIQQSGFVTVTPSMINNGSYDNCTPTASLVMQVSPNTFTCQDLGSKTVSLTVTDQAGNSAFCQTTVVVQDNFDICPNQNFAFIAGKVAMEGSEPISQKLIGLTGGVNMGVYTEVDGTYDFPGLPLGQNYTVKPTYNTKVLNGVTTFDLVLIQRHILGIAALGSPYKIIAADANKSGTVTTIDIVELRKLILNVTTTLPNGNTSWRFVRSNHVFTNPLNPFQPPFPESVAIQNLETNHWNLDFVGIKVGDVNGSADPSNLDGGDGNEDRDFGETFALKTEDIDLVAGQVYAIPFVAATSQALAGFQFTLDFDETTLDFTGMDAGVVSQNNVGTANLETGALTVSWDNIKGQVLAANETIFTLHFAAKSNGRLSDALAINSRVTPAEAYRGELLANTTLDMLGVSLEFETAQAEPSSYLLFQNTPNPFHQTTTVRFYLPEASEAALRIYDVYGQLLRQYKGNYEKGTHSVELELGGFTKSSILFCELVADGQRRQVIKMVSD
ncbi:MAG: HYR domain-containing protein [Saprospiraceae bacterium]